MGFVVLDRVYLCPGRSAARMVCHDASDKNGSHESCRSRSFFGGCSFVLYNDRLDTPTSKRGVHVAVGHVDGDIGRRGIDIGL
jgi:hypothetical protein